MAKKERWNTEGKRGEALRRRNVINNLVGDLGILKQAVLFS